MNNYALGIIRVKGVRYALEIPALRRDHLLLGERFIVAIAERGDLPKDGPGFGHELLPWAQRLFLRAWLGPRLPLLWCDPFSACAVLARGPVGLYGALPAALKRKIRVSHLCIFHEEADALQYFASLSEPNMRAEATQPTSPSPPRTLFDSSHGYRHQPRAHHLYCLRRGGHRGRRLLRGGTLRRPKSTTGCGSLACGRWGPRLPSSSACSSSAPG
jgi:hypothetical protein